MCGTGGGGTANGGAMWKWRPGRFSQIETETSMKEING